MSHPGRKTVPHVDLGKEHTFLSGAYVMCMKTPLQVSGLYEQWISMWFDPLDIHKKPFMFYIYIKSD